MVFRSQTEAFIKAEELRGVSVCLGFPEVFYQVSQNMDLQCQKQVQKTPPPPTWSLSTSASHLVHKAHKGH